MGGRLRWCGLLARMGDSKLPKVAFYSELRVGRRKAGGQNLRYKDVVKRSLTSCRIPLNGWEGLASSKPDWRNAVKKGFEGFEKRRLEDLDARCHDGRTRSRPVYSYTYNASSQLYCKVCDRVFKTKIGSVSHVRSHGVVSTRKASS